MLFQAVVIFLPILNFLKISCKRGKVHWETNTEYIIKKATKRLYFLKVLKSYGAPKNYLRTFYCCVIRSTLEYGAQVWNRNLLTQAQRSDFERVQKRALRIIVPEYEYNRALHECGLKTLQQRRDDLCEFVLL